MVAATLVASHVASDAAWESQRDPKLTCSAAAVLIYAYVVYQQRLTMIASRHAGSFDQLWGPILICLALFVAILVNFIVRLQDAREKHGDTNPLSFANAWKVAGEKSTWLN